MIELLSPAGSPEAVIAAVQNGADAVYMGMGNFNARRGAKNFTGEEWNRIGGQSEIVQHVFVDFFDGVAPRIAVAIGFTLVK